MKNEFANFKTKKDKGRCNKHTNCVQFLEMEMCLKEHFQEGAARASIGGDGGGDALQPGDIKNVPPLFQLKKTNLQAYSETGHSSLLNKTYIGLVVQLIYQFRYKLPTTQWKSLDKLRGNH